MKMARAGNPAPATVQIAPTAIVKRSESPWRVVDPTPAPRRDPHPATVTIRGPASRYIGRRPYVAVLGLVAPPAIAIQIFVADDFARHILRRCGAFTAAIAI